MSADATLLQVERLLGLLPGVKLAWVQRAPNVFRLGLVINDVYSLGVLAHIAVAANVPMHVETAWDCAGKCDKPDCVRYDWRIPIESGSSDSPSSLQLIGGMVAETLKSKALLPASEADQLLRDWSFEIPVTFSDLSIGEVKRRFAIQLDESADFFANAAPVAPASLLAETLRENIPLALAIGTEKARSELIVAPVLVEIRRQLSHAISLFSGVEWNVDPAQGLRGVCDFLFSLSPEQFDIEAPVVAIVEAKKEDMGLGMGQCLAEMVAARIFNERRQNPISTVYGVVTTGNVWRFLRLVEDSAFVDTTEYHIKEIERIIGILLSMFKDGGAPDKT